MQIYKLKESCAVCESKNLHVILNYKEVPLAGDFPKYEELSIEQKFPLNILFCENCTLLQTDSIIDAGVLFKDYRYMSSIGLSKHFTETASWIREKLVPKWYWDNLYNYKALEIGSNDGVLLRPLQDLGMDIIGIDPAENIDKIAKEKGCNTICDYFNEKSADKYNWHHKFDLIIANNCFAHIENIHSVVEGTKKSLKDNGLFFIEVHYVKPLILSKEWDNIYHEHCMYWSLNSLKYLFDLHGMSIVYYEEIPIHSGSIRLVVQNVAGATSQKVIERIQQEKDWGITSVQWYSDFGKRTEEHINLIHDTVVKIKNEGYKIAGYGASGRANMVCNLSKLTPDLIDYIVDESPERSGRYISGTHIPIVGKEMLDTNKPDYIFIFAWNFAEMIMEKLKDYNFEYILAFPTMQIIHSYDEYNK